MPAMASPYIRLLQLFLATHSLASPATGSRRDVGSSLVSLPIIHSTNQDVFAEVWEKREATVVPLANRSDVAYYAKLNIGTPPQPQYVQLDTGSFELWVNPDCNTLSGAADVRFCQAVGKYVAADSATAVSQAGTKTLRYGIGTANIQYVKDDIQVSDTRTKLKAVQFGVAISTVDEFAGILGIGYGNGVTLRYPNFVDELEAQGATQTKAFSLALGSKREQEGVIIFGGMDTGKYSGTLTRLPIIPAANSPDRVPRYWVQMNNISLTPPSGNTRIYANSSMAVFLDSGATLTLLPTAMAAAIASDFGAAGPDANGFYTVDCSFNNLPGTLDFAFQGLTVKVPYWELIRESRTSFGTTCYLGISASSDFVLLGDTFLRSAYAVFDLTNNAIWMGQYVNCGSNPMEILDSTQIRNVTGRCPPPATKAVTSPSSSTAAVLPTGSVTTNVPPAAAGQPNIGSSSSAGSSFISKASSRNIWITALCMAIISSTV